MRICVRETEAPTNQRATNVPTLKHSGVQRELRHAALVALLDGVPDIVPVRFYRLDSGEWMVAW